ncbi:MFS transporter [Nocardioides sp. JQ2195]|uniref:MFS transporter n=1 Tax=Nocardioides sp. JQ2195 TaxID=2592334 RepID=UPI00143E62D1|nr:MFS transporter [Nocardioides sp. JQ2195]QIX28468.1 MFS transporter [Nocardioides sp. JQ2195]
MADRSTSRGLVAACLAASLMPLNSTMIAVAVPDVSAELDHDPTTVTQALVTTYLVAAIALQSPGGKLGDRLGQWRVLTLGQVVLGVGALLGFLAPTLVLLSVSRVLMAVGGALVVPAAVALIRIALPPDRRGRAFGMFGAVMSLAAGIGPIVGGELVRFFGWESIFLANLPVLALSAVLAVGAPHGSRSTSSTGFDWLGSVLLTAAVATGVLAVEATSSTSATLLVLSVVLWLPFVVWERRTRDPVVAFELFRGASFTAGTLLIALLNLVMYALLFEIPLVLETVFDLDAQHTGRLLVFMMLAMVATSMLAGRLVDRVGARLVALVGLLVCLVGTGLLLVGSLDAPDEVRLPLALLGVGLGLANPASQTAALASVSREQSGMAAGIGSTIRYLGGIVGVAVLARVLDTSGAHSAVLAQHHTLLAIFVGVLVGGLLCIPFLPGADRALGQGEDVVSGRRARRAGLRRR